ncbi:MAG: hypothetical protein ABL962_00800 [Fimbriimonadaceae bacterium]
MNSTIAPSRGVKNFLKVISGYLLASVLIFVCVGAGGCPGTPMPFVREFDVTATVTPSIVTLQPGQSVSLRVEVDGGGGSGDVDTRVTAKESNDPNKTLPCTPSDFVSQIGLTAPHVQDVNVSVPTGTAPGQYDFKVFDDHGSIGTATIIVSNGTAGGSFSFTATPLEVSTKTNVNSSDVTFTVTSVGGFSGQVTVNWVADGDASPFTGENNFVGTVTPSTPWVFKRKMYRWATHAEDIPINFNVTNLANTIERSVVINVKYAL